MQELLPRNISKFANSYQSADINEYLVRPKTRKMEISVF